MRPRQRPLGDKTPSPESVGELRTTRVKVPRNDDPVRVSEPQPPDRLKPLVHAREARTRA